MRAAVWFLGILVVAILIHPVLADGPDTGLPYKAGTLAWSGTGSDTITVTPETGTGWGEYPLQHLYLWYNGTIGHAPVSYEIPDAGCRFDASNGWSGWLWSVDHVAKYNYSYGGVNYTSATVTATFIDLDSDYNETAPGPTYYLGTRMVLHWDFTYVNPAIAGLSGNIQMTPMIIMDNISYYRYFDYGTVHPVLWEAIGSWRYWNVSDHLGATFAFDSPAPFNDLPMSHDGVHDYGYSANWGVNYSVTNVPATANKVVVINRTPGYNPSYLKVLLHDGTVVYTSATATVNETLSFAATRALFEIHSVTNGADYMIFDDGVDTPPAGTTTIQGYAIDAYTGLTLASVTAQATQGTNVFTSTTGSGGHYNLTNIANSIPLTLDAIKAGYTFSPFSFTPWGNLTYNINLSLIPTTIPGHDPTHTAIDGIVYTSWSHDPVKDATVTITNGTWTDTYPTTASGFYLFDNLAGGTDYHVSATATGFQASSSYLVTAWAGSVTQQDIALKASYHATITARDGITSLIIQGIPVYFECSDGQTANTTTGSTIFTVDGGLLTFTATATGYSAAQQQVSVTGDTAVTLLMYNVTPTQTPQQRVIVQPHEVRFIVHDIYGAGIQDVEVTAVGWASTMPNPVQGLLEFFGINTATMPANSTMNGTTGTDGSITFIMYPAFKYNVTLTKAGYSIPIQYIWPKEEEYLITAYPQEQPSTTNLGMQLWCNSSSGTGGCGYDGTLGANQVKVALDYNDTAVNTSVLEFYVRDKNKATVFHTTLTNLGWGQPNYTIAIAPNQVWYWGFNATNTLYAENITGDSFLRTETRPVNLPIPDLLQDLMSAAFIIIVMGLGSRDTMHQVMVFDCFFAIGLTWMGVFPAMNNIVGWPLMMGALGFSVLFYMRRKERTEGV